MQIRSEERGEEEEEEEELMCMERSVDVVMVKLYTKSEWRDR